MTIGYWCVLASALLPYAFTLLAKSGGRYNNYSPREFLEKQEGFRKRAHWAQLNGFEAFPPFAAAVIIAHLAGTAQATIDMLAVSFVIVRIIYSALYIANIALLRSVAWMAGIALVVALFVTAA